MLGQALLSNDVRNTAGFLFSSMGRGVTQPNRLIWLLYAGAVSLGLGVTALGIGLLTA